MQIELDTAEALAVFSRLEEAAGGLGGLWKDVGEHLKLAHRYRFDVAISPDGDLWEPLDPAYRRRKKRRKDDILVLDTYLRDQLSYRASNAGLEFGTNRIYGAAHQFGTDDIPARPWLGVSDDDRAHILSLAERHLAEAKK